MRLPGPAGMGTWTLPAMRSAFLAVTLSAWGGRARLCPFGTVIALRSVALTEGALSGQC